MDCLGQALPQDLARFPYTAGQIGQDDSLAWEHTPPPFPPPPPPRNHGPNSSFQPSASGH